MKHSYLMRTLVILFFPITAIAETYQMEKMVKKEVSLQLQKKRDKKEEKKEEERGRRSRWRRR